MKYEKQGQFGLEEGFQANPLMAAIKLARYKFPAKMMSDNDRVIDLGCGNGLSSYFFSTMTKGEVVGLDLYADINQVSNSFGQNNLRFLKGDLW